MLDQATILGMLSGTILIIWGIYLGGTLRAFIDIPSILIVFGGVIASVLINYPLGKLKDVFKILKTVFLHKPIEAGDIIKTIVDLAEIARREGLLALEDAAYQLEDDFMKRGILLIVDGTDPELVKNILETELTFLEERHREGQAIFETMGSMSPAYGLLGTIIGLINMLGQIDNPEAVGPGMATALVTTFYGSVLANFLFLPIAGKLKVRSQEEVLLKEVMIEGMLSIQAGENPRIIEEKLNAFLSPKIRTSIKTSQTKESGEGYVTQPTAK